MLTGYPGFYSPVIPPLLLLSLYLAMSLPLIDGLLVLPLPLVRKLAFVCLSVKELKEDALLTDVYKGTSSVCVCVCMCVTLLVSIASSWSLKQCEFYLVTMETGANRRAE